MSYKPGDKVRLIAPALDDLTQHYIEVGDEGVVVEINPERFVTFGLHVKVLWRHPDGRCYSCGRDTRSWWVNPSTIARSNGLFDVVKEK